MLGPKIKELRKRRHLSQDRLAQMLNVSRPTLSRWERNEAVPDSDQLTRIANTFQVNVRYLIDDDMSYEDIGKNDSDIGNEEIVEQLVRINDNFAEELARRRDSIKRISLIILIIVFAVSMMFAILIVTNMHSPGDGFGKDTIIYYVSETK